MSNTLVQVLYDDFDVSLFGFGAELWRKIASWKTDVQLNLDRAVIADARLRDAKGLRTGRVSKTLRSMIHFVIKEITEYIVEAAYGIAKHIIFLWLLHKMDIIEFYPVL